MKEIEKATENSSKAELSLVELTAQLFNECPLTLEEKMVNLPLFMRRQELSYLLARYELFKLIQNVKGSIFYFGVFHGGGLMSFANFSAALEPFNHTREIVGFDTFSGYPKIGDKDITHGKSFKTLEEGGFSSPSKDFLEHLCVAYDQNRALNHIPKIKLVAGDVCETLPQYLQKNQHTVVSMMVLTMNLYEPTKLALDLIWPRMPVGGIVNIHSLNEEFYPGATCALFDSLGGQHAIRTFPFAPNLAYVVKL